MNWQPIASFPKPTEEWDMDTPAYLFYLPGGGIRVGVCGKYRLYRHRVSTWKGNHESIKGAKEELLAPKGE